MPQFEIDGQDNDSKLLFTIVVEAGAIRIMAREENKDIRYYIATISEKGLNRSESLPSHWTKYFPLSKNGSILEYQV